MSSDEDLGSVEFVTRDSMLMLFIYSDSCRVFVYHVYAMQDFTKLLKVDHCCLSLSRALGSCNCFQLCCFVTERQFLCS